MVVIQAQISLWFRGERILSCIGRALPSQADSGRLEQILYVDNRNINILISALQLYIIQIIKYNTHRYIRLYNIQYYNTIHIEIQLEFSFYTQINIPNIPNIPNIYILYRSYRSKTAGWPVGRLVGRPAVGRAVGSRVAVAGHTVARLGRKPVEQRVAQIFQAFLSVCLFVYIIYMYFIFIGDVNRIVQIIMYLIVERFLNYVYRYGVPFHTYNMKS